ERIPCRARDLRRRCLEDVGAPGLAEVRIRSGPWRPVDEDLKTGRYRGEREGEGERERRNEGIDRARERGLERAGRGGEVRRVRRSPDGGDSCAIEGQAVDLIRRRASEERAVDEPAPCRVQPRHEPVGETA